MELACAPAVKTAIFDLDGTLAKIDHRLHHVQKIPPNWNAFFEEMGSDPFNVHVGDTLNALRISGFHIVLCSGRPEKYRAVTTEWLAAYKVHHELLMMRPDGDYRPDHLIKKEMLTRMRSLSFEPVVVFDDRVSVIRMWREQGLEVFQVKGHEQTTFPDSAQLTLMIGPSGAGKTSWLKGMINNPPYPHEFGILPWHVISSDEIREDLTGDWMNQTQNDEVFKALHAIAYSRLSHGLPTVIDATNIRNKDRKAIVELVPTTVPVRYVIINRPLSEKRETGGWRNELEGVDLIGRMDHTFRTNLPEILAGDGFPNVKIIDLRKGDTKASSPVDNSASN